MTFTRDVKEVTRWLDDNESITTELGDDLEQNETIHDNFVKFMTQFNKTG